MALVEATTIDRIKRRYDVGGSSTKDTLIGEVIASVSKAIEDYLAKPLSSEERTEVYEVLPRSSLAFLRAAPVSAIAEVKNRSTKSTAWASVTAMDADQYDFDPETGCLFFCDLLFPGPLALQVTYTAGFGANAAAIVSGYPTIAEAADIQVFEVLRAYDGGTFRSGSVVTGQGQTIARTQALDLLPSVKSMLNPYRKVVV